MLVNCTSLTPTFPGSPAGPLLCPCTPPSSKTAWDPRAFGEIGWGLYGFHAGLRVWVSAAGPAQELRHEDPLSKPESGPQCPVHHSGCAWGWDQWGVQMIFPTGGGCPGPKASQARPVHEEQTRKSVTARAWGHHCSPRSQSGSRKVDPMLGRGGCFLSSRGPAEPVSCIASQSHAQWTLLRHWQSSCSKSSMGLLLWAQMHQVLGLWWWQKPPVRSTDKLLEFWKLLNV